jgi:hypothetical protein
LQVQIQTPKILLFSLEKWPLFLERFAFLKEGTTFFEKWYTPYPEKEMLSVNKTMNR